ncbi:hypothetical protein MTR67_011770 [Solanum verrucosum]|uniref:Gag-pol polyprotein n=1 Tax=Solanum verrucosum TaxID=315347 RepID=A0AAF0TMB3_SOLVR|nr:hypothetical protein MTR67_011770 [Solanum verrucosum]
MSFQIMPSRRAVREHPSRRNVNPQFQEAPNAPEVQPPKRDVTNINPPEFTRSKINDDPKNFMDELQKVFEVMHVADVERVELAAYKLKGIARIWFD